MSKQANRLRTVGFTLSEMFSYQLGTYCMYKYIQHSLFTYSSSLWVTMVTSHLLVMKILYISFLISRAVAPTVDTELLSSAATLGVVNY